MTPESRFGPSSFDGSIPNATYEGQPSVSRDIIEQRCLSLTNERFLKKPKVEATILTPQVLTYSPNCESSTNFLIQPEINLADKDSREPGRLKQIFSQGNHENLYWALKIMFLV